MTNKGSDYNKCTPEFIQGFSRWSRKERTDLIMKMINNSDYASLPALFRIPDPALQERFESFSENTISNFHLPYGIAPNFLIDGRLFHVPMVIEESSVVAAAARSARFWYFRGGFQTQLVKTEKAGQIHFSFSGGHSVLEEHFPAIRNCLMKAAAPLEEGMKKRGGGITGVHLLPANEEMPGMEQIRVSFQTADAMGANFINSCLESMAQALEAFISSHSGLQAFDYEPVMAILSNYTPDSRVKMRVQCSIDQLNDIYPGMDGQTFARRFYRAVQVARHDPFRATTHNKGIMNGSDAVVLATGNDFRATEAAAHAYAARDGQYRSLTNCTIHRGVFTYELELPLAVGSIGGLTRLHPMARLSMEMLGNPDAKQLMKIIAAAGMANNFGAIRSLVTEGIQKGHMKLHLDNILAQLNASKKDAEKAKEHFKSHTVSYQNVKKFLNELQG